MNSKSRLILTLLSLFTVHIQHIQGFDATLDTTRDSRRWKFIGDHSYANSSSSNEIKTFSLRPRVLSASPITEEVERSGIWYAKHIPGGNNTWKIDNSLSHLLFVQGWVTLLAHPSVPIIVTTSNNKEVGRFWSDGKNWCDAVFNIGYHNMFTVEIRTPKSEEYAMIDKIVLGIMGNITALKGKTIHNPCLTAPLTDDTKPDMMTKIGDSNDLRRRTNDDTPPDMNFTTEASGTAGQRNANSTLMRTYQTESGGAKCDCVCTCTKPTNMSSTSTMSPANI